MAGERGTAAERIGAARALIRIADRVQLDRRANDLLYPEIVSACRDDLCAVVDRGITRLAAGDRPGFDLGVQLVLFICALAGSEPDRAAEAGRRLAAAHPGDRALRELAEARGDSPFGRSRPEAGGAGAGCGGPRA